jgi:phage terminase small subunit
MGKEKDSTAKSKLNPKQRLFCELYASNKEFYGNGTQSYIEAYDIDTTKKGAYTGAKASAGKLLTNTNILAYIDEIMEHTVLNDQFADKQLGFLITQNAELNVKLGAIRHYSDLKQRIKNKLEIGMDKETATLLGMIDGKGKGHLPTSGEAKEAG